MSNVMPQIKTVVHLMLENRSLDNLLGWLYYQRTPRHFFPPENSTAYDGLAPGKYHNPSKSISGVHQYPVTTIPSKYQSERVPAYDPYEAMREGSEWNGVMNQLFGNQNMISSMPKPDSHAAMQGFLQDYYARYMVEWQGLDILWTYSTQQAPIINKLAYQYAVSDRWYSSVPTQTNPNRAFSLCGTSLGREANANLQAVEQFNVPTLINKLAAAGKSWGLFYEDTWQQGKCYTDYTFPQIAQAPNGQIKTMENFFALAQAGKLPAFTYVEPKWGYGKGSFYVQGHDYHPPTQIQPGEQFLWKIYSALRNSSQWPHTLFIVTFDEHGGTYDHNTPPWTAVNPDGKNGTKWHFDFQLYGARVPTILISPYVRPQTVFRAPNGSPHPYDHTSVISTLLRWAGVDPANAGLGKRVASAPCFDAVLANTIVNETGLEEAEPLITSTGESVETPTDAPTPLQEIGTQFAGVSFVCMREILRQNETLADIEAAIKRYHQDPQAFEADVAASMSKQ